MPLSIYDNMKRLALAMFEKILILFSRTKKKSQKISF